MAQWDDLRNKLRQSQEEAAEATKRSNQEHDIVRLQQGGLWSELAKQFFEAVTIINTGQTVLNFSQPPTNSNALRVSVPRGGSNPPAANVTFNENGHEVMVAYSGIQAPVLKYTIRANSSNRTEFSNRGGQAVDPKDIVNETISHLA